jgi:RNA polymerase sigma-70 factor (ECF subfamily)
VAAVRARYPAAGPKPREAQAIEDERLRIEALYSRYSRSVARYVFVRTGAEELAEEITSRVFAVVVRKIHQCRGNQTGWLWSIVRSELAMHFRQRRDHAPIDEDVANQLLDSDSPPALLVHCETVDQLRHAMDHLSDEQQTLIYMKFFQDMPNIKIADAVRLTPSNVGVKVHRAIRRLRDLMEEPDDVGAAEFVAQHERNSDCDS